MIHGLKSFLLNLATKSSEYLTRGTSLLRPLTATSTTASCSNSPVADSCPQQKPLLTTATESGDQMMRQAAVKVGTRSLSTSNVKLVVPVAKQKWVEVPRWNQREAVQYDSITKWEEVPIKRSPTGGFETMDVTVIQRLPKGKRYY